PLLVGVLFEIAGGWRVPLVALAAVGVAWCSAFWPWFRDRPEQMRQVNADEGKLIASGRGADPAGRGHAPVAWCLMLRSRSVWALCFMSSGIGFSGTFFLSLLPDYLRTYRRLDAYTASWLQALPFAFGAIACVAGGALSDAIIRQSGSRRWGRRLVGASGLALASASILATVWVQPTWLLATLLVLTFVGNDLAMGPSWAAAADIGERHAGTLGGAMNMVSALASTAAALIMGSLLHGGQVVLLFVIFASSYGLGALLWFGV